MASNTIHSSSMTSTAIIFTLNGNLRSTSPPMKPEELLGTLRYTHGSPMSNSQQSQYIQDAEHDVDIYDGYIEQIQALSNRYVDQLRVKQAVLKRDIAFYGALSSPIRRLSPEILRQIFGFAVDNNTFADTNDAQWWSPAFILSAVCRHWRDIVLDSPELWADMVISLEDRAIFPVNLALERSRQHPLTVQLHSTYHEEDDDSSRKLFLMLDSNIGRWRRLSLIEVTDEAIDRNLGLYLSTPALEAIDCTERDADFLFSNVFTAAPNLHTISIDYFYYNPLEQSFPPSTIRHVKLPFDRTSNLTTLSRQLKVGAALESLCLTGQATPLLDQYRASTLNLTDERRVVTNLRSVEVALGNQRGFYPLMHDFFQIFIFPSMSTLSVTFTTPAHRTELENTSIEFVDVWARDSLNNCLSRSSCDLTTLSLCGIPLTESDLTSLFRRTPSVHTLTIRELCALDGDIDKPPQRVPYQTVTKSLLQQLAAPTLTSSAFADVQHTLLSKLTSLTMAVQHHFNADEEFVDMIRSRWVERNIRTVVLYVVGRGLVSELYEPMRKMDKEGLMVSVFSNRQRVV